MHVTLMTGILAARCWEKLEPELNTENGNLLEMKSLKNAERNRIFQMKPRIHLNAVVRGSIRKNIWFLASQRQDPGPLIA